MANKKLKINIKGHVQKQKKVIITFPEIHITYDQIEMIAMPLYGCTATEIIDYYKGKIHGKALLINSEFTTREDQPDFQYLIDLGIKALASGMLLEEQKSKQNTYQNG